MTGAWSARRWTATVTSALMAAIVGLTGCERTRETPVATGSATSSRLKSELVRFTPRPLPDTVEVVNPLRGAQYGGVTPPTDTPPPGYPQADRYDRFCWSALEPRRGEYDFRQIDMGLAAAQRAGYTFGFRVMPIHDRLPCSPDYLPRQPDGFYPDFNAFAYLDAAGRLFAALGNRYADDPRLGLMDVSLYGCWGEWHESCGSFTAMTAANRRRLIDLQYAALPHTRFLMLTAQGDSLTYALSVQRELPTGVRVDCLGSAGLGGSREELAAVPMALERWRTAPMYFEYCATDLDRPGSTQPNFARAADDVTRYHASIVGDGLGNLRSFTAYGAADQNNLMKSFLRSGYRYRLVDVTVPGTIRPGQPLSLTSRWVNANAAYTYQPWSVRFELRPADAAEGEPVWRAASTLDLRQPFADNPTGGELRTITDTVTVPAGVHAGIYQLCVRISAAGHRPLALAIIGATQDGAYCLGALTMAPA